SSANHSDEVDADGFLKDVQVMSIDEASENPRQEQRSRDITNKKMKKPIAFVNEVTTMRRHMDASHRNEYLTWAEAEKFVSMLPKDTK
ncbi:hypothetical protein CY34DRAFT_36941, partial [Suillus luteus UH-Slu-Lm8-n1]